MNLIQYDCYSDIGGRIENEDSVMVCKKHLSGKYAFVVADGLGGHGGGKTASSAVVSSIKEHWSGSANTQEWKHLLEIAHEDVKKQQSKECKMKSTMAGLLINGDKMAWAHVGDSRFYHFYEDKLVFQTRDHSASQLAVMLGEIQPEDIRFHEARSQVLKALGQANKLVPECKEESIGKGKHAFLLCSDGFWEYITEAEMGQTLLKAESPGQWLRHMRSIAQKRMKPGNDNHTAITVFLKKI